MTDADKTDEVEDLTMPLADRDKRKVLKEAAQRVRVLERLGDRQKAADGRRRDREERKLLDEISSTMMREAS